MLFTSQFLLLRKSTPIVNFRFHKETDFCLCYVCSISFLCSPVVASIQFYIQWALPMFLLLGEKMLKIGQKKKKKT